MKMMKWVVAALSALSLVACGGGGGDAGSSPFNPNPNPPGSVATNIDVLASAVQVGTAGEQVTITAIVKGAGNVSLADAPVSFSTDTGTLTSASGTTDDAGVATATLTAGANKANRTITVTVTSGTAQGSVQVAVAGTELEFQGVTTVALASAANLSVTLTDSLGNAISGVPVTIASSLNNGLSATTVTTNALGSAAFTYTATNAGTDTLTFNAANVTLTQEITISGENFVFISPNPDTKVAVGTPQAVTVRYLSGGLPQTGVTVNFAATAGALNASSAVTNASGDATVSITSTTASPATVQATLTGPVSATATLPITFVALTPANLVLQVTPTAIPPNPTGTSANQSRLVATVTDANGNPVSGATVNFNRIADPSGGNLSAASRVTDGSGQATVQYIAGAVTTASNGVQIRATVASAPAVFGDAALTVNQSALFIALGTGNVIENIDPQTYKKDWVVYVTDANGIAVPNIDLTIKILPLSYGKGELKFANGAWGHVIGSSVFCANEDLNYNGVLDAGEDTDGSGTLEPGNVISVTPGVVRTGADGRATVSVIYAESYAKWVTVRLRAEAVVSGTESSKEAVFVVPGESGDFTNANVGPAGQSSPFGVNGCGTPN